MSRQYQTRYDCIPKITCEFVLELGMGLCLEGGFQDQQPEVWCSLRSKQNLTTKAESVAM